MNFKIRENNQESSSFFTYTKETSEPNKMTKDSSKITKARVQ